MIVFLTKMVERCEHRQKGIIVSCAIVVPIESVGAVEFLAVILVWLQVVSAVVCRGREHSAKRVVVRYLSYNAKFVYNGAVVAIVKPVFHDFKSVFYGGKCTKLFLIAVFFARILKNESGKPKGLDSSFSALLLILQGYALGTLQKTVNALRVGNPS